MNNELSERIGKIKTAEKNIQVNFWIIGNELIEIKEMVPHGEFTRIIEENFTFSERTARRFMLIARKFKSDNIVELGLNNSLSLIEHIPDEELDEEGKIDIDSYVEDDDEEDYATPSRPLSMIVPQEEEIKKREDEMMKALEEAKEKKGYFQWLYDGLINSRNKLRRLKSFLNAIKGEEWMKHYNNFEGHDKIKELIIEIKEIADEIKIPGGRK